MARTAHESCPRLILALEHGPCTANSDSHAFERTSQSLSDAFNASVCTEQSFSFTGTCVGHHGHVEDMWNCSSLNVPSDCK